MIILHISSYSSYILHNSIIFLHSCSFLSPPAHIWESSSFIFLHTSFIPISPPMYYGLWDLEKFRVFELGRILSSSICLYRDLEESKNPSYLIYGHETCFSFPGEGESFIKSHRRPKQINNSLKTLVDPMHGQLPQNCPRELRLLFTAPQ